MDNSSGETIVAILIFFAIPLLIGLALIVLTVIGQWKTLKKMGRRGWACLIPIYNMWEFGNGSFVKRNKTIALTVLSAVNWICSAIITFTILGGLFKAIASGATSYSSYDSPMSIITSVCSLIMSGAGIALFVLEIFLFISMSRAFGKDGVWCLIAVFVPTVYFCILGFSKNIYYIGPDGYPLGGAYPPQGYGGQPYGQQPPYVQPSYGQQMPYGTPQQQYSATQPPYAQQPYEQQPYNLQPQPYDQPQSCNKAPNQSWPPQ